MAIKAQSDTVASQTTSGIVIVDYRQVPFVIALGGVMISAGTLTYKAQYTLDDPFDSTVTPVWYDHATITGKSANFADSLLIPCRAVRLNVTAYTSGSVALKVLQGQQ